MLHRPVVEFRQPLHNRHTNLSLNFQTNLGASNPTLEGVYYQAYHLLSQFHPERYFPPSMYEIDARRTSATPGCFPAVQYCRKIPIKTKYK